MLVLLETSLHMSDYQPVMFKKCNIWILGPKKKKLVSGKSDLTLNTLPVLNCVTELKKKKERDYHVALAFCFLHKKLTL